MNLHLNSAKFIFIFLCAMTVTSLATAAVHVGISGSVATNNLGLEVHRSQAGKASLGLDLGSYFRLSLSAQQRVEREHGYKDMAEDEEDEDLVAYEAEIRQMTYALDLIAVLYQGELLTPFIFVGAAFKGYDINSQTEGEEPVHAEAWYGPVPNYGGGLAVSLNKNFSLKLTNTWSDGVRVDPDDTSKQRKVRDVQTDIGLSYKFD